MVSIVIPCFNLGEYLEDAIDSVKAQTFKDWELIVVDDGSTDEKTIHELDKLTKTHPDIKVYRKANSGLAGARNYGIEHANGEYIVCLDADDALHSNYLEKTVTILEADGARSLGFVTTWLQEFGERNNVWQTSDFDIPKLLVSNVAHAGSMFRKTAWAKVGGYKKMKIGGYEDWEFWLSIVEKGYEWKTVKEPLFFYRIRENSMLSGARSTHVAIYQMLFEFHERLFAQYSKELIVENAKEVRQLHVAIAQKNQSIEELEKFREEVINLRVQLLRLKNEINVMKNARLLGRIIRLREYIGATRQKISPRSTLHRIRVMGAPFVPGPLRRFVKRSYRKIRYGRPRPPQIIKTANKIWNKDWPLVSVIIPYYNRADTIDETLNSLASQTFANFETIIVDDGSTDPESVQKLAELEKSGISAKIIKQKNQGVAAARNNGISQARGRYIICLDSDDLLEPSYIEKCTIALESSPDISLVTTYTEMFGLNKQIYKNNIFHPLDLYHNNQIITAAEFRKKAWRASGGYKSGIGYEDWEYWIALSEKGFWGKLIPEVLFRYRTSMQSRYVEDQELHGKNLRTIKALHPNYRKNIKKLLSKRKAIKQITEPNTAFVNLKNKTSYRLAKNSKPNILIALPWMTFGGAETVIINFCQEIKDRFNLSFITGLDSQHEWEHKFKIITPNIYHLANLFDSKELYLEFISNYINTRGINAIHIIHTDYVFDMLGELKKRHPKLRVAATLFNDRAAHFGESLKARGYIDVFTSDNSTVSQHYRRELGQTADIRIIPNGINSNDNFNPILYDKSKERQALGIREDELAVFFIARLSEEKNPDVFLEVAKKIVAEHRNAKFFVIGDGIMAEEVKRGVATINSDNVRYLGYQTEVAKYLAAADIFVLPSSIEGFPPSILEAMAMRVAVVASDVGAVAEIIKSGTDGFVVTAGSVNEIAEKIATLNQNRKLLASIKGLAREKIDKKYSTTIMGKNYQKLYNDLAK